MFCCFESLPSFNGSDAAKPSGWWSEAKQIKASPKDIHPNHADQFSAKTHWILSAIILLCVAAPLNQRAQLASHRTKWLATQKSNQNIRLFSVSHCWQLNKLFLVKIKIFKKKKKPKKTRNGQIEALKSFLLQTKNSNKVIWCRLIYFSFCFLLFNVNKGAILCRGVLITVL